MNREQMHKYYEEWWDNPKDSRNVIFKKLKDYISSSIPETKNGKALDIGSGKGSIINLLLEKGYKVTGIESSPVLADELKKKYPNVRIINKNILDVSFNEKYDIVTCIELIQNLNNKELEQLINIVSPITNKLFVNICPEGSFHDRYTKLMNMQKDFVYTHQPKYLELLIEKKFHIINRKGIGIITPVTLFKNFKCKIIPNILVELLSPLDDVFPHKCHLYYVECVK